MRHEPGLTCQLWTVTHARDTFGVAPVFWGTYNWGALLDADDEPAPDMRTTEAVHVLDRAHGVRYVVTVTDDGESAPTLATEWRGAVHGSLAGAVQLSDAELAAVAAGFLRRRRAWRADPQNADEIAAGVDYSESRDDTGTPHRRPALARVASEVRLARHAGVPVERWFGPRGEGGRTPWEVSPATTRRWVKAAREAGLLPELSGEGGRPTKRPDDRSLARSVRDAEAAGTSPAHALAEKYGVTPAAARGWIRRLAARPDEGNER